MPGTMGLPPIRHHTVLDLDLDLLCRSTLRRLFILLPQRRGIQLCIPPPRLLLRVGMVRRLIRMGGGALIIFSLMLLVNHPRMRIGIVGIGRGRGV